MDILATVDDLDILQRSFQEIINNFPIDSSIIIAEQIFMHGGKYMRDAIRLAINYNGSKEFAEILQQAIDKESINTLKKNLQQVLDNLK